MKRSLIHPATSFAVLALMSIASSAAMAQQFTSGTAPAQTTGTRYFLNDSQGIVQVQDQELQEPPIKPGNGLPPFQDVPPEAQLNVPPSAIDSTGQISGGAFSAISPELAASPFLQFGQLNVGYSWSYADTDHIYFGTERQFEGEQVAQVAAYNNTHTVAFEMGLCDRWSLVYELPFQANGRSQQTGPLSGGRITGLLVTDTADVADSRLYLRRWLYEANALLPIICQPGNVSFGFGVEIPTGRADKFTYFNGGDGGNNYFHDISVQTGSDSTDIYLAGAAYFEYGRFIPFAGFNWTITPQEHNGVQAFHPQLVDPNTPIVNTVNDSLTWTIGVRYACGDRGTACCRRLPCCQIPRRACDPCTGRPRDPLFTVQRLSLTFSLDGAHVPRSDIFGDSTGFRRAFDSLFVTPGLHYDLGQNCTVFASVPLTVYRDLTTEPGTFPHTQLIVGAAFSIR